MWKSKEPKADSHIPTVPAATAIPTLNLPAICRPVLAYSGTAQRSPYSRCFHPSVSRPAALPKLNLRGRCPVIVPANGCLAKLLLLWSLNQVEGSSPLSKRFGKSQVQGNLRLPLTSTYHGCPRFFRNLAMAMPRQSVRCGCFQMMENIALSTGLGRPRMPRRHGKAHLRPVPLQ
jgi:hypothetical protein